MSEAYESESILVAYIKWHYGKGLREIFGVISNFLWFVTHFFSFKLLAKTLFAPWKRLGESYSGGFDLGTYASAFAVNTLMRLFGLVSRMIVLFVGLVSYLFVLVFSLFVLIIWVLAPMVLLGSLVLSATFFVI